MSRRKIEIVVQYDDGDVLTYDSFECARVAILEFFAEGILPLSVARQWEDTKEEIEEVGLTWDVSFSKL